LKRPAFGALGIERDMVAVCEGYRGVVVYLELWLWKFTDASRDVLASVAGTTDIKSLKSQTLNRGRSCSLRVELDKGESIHKSKLAGISTLDLCYRKGCEVAVQNAGSSPKSTGTTSMTMVHPGVHAEVTKGSTKFRYNRASYTRGFGMRTASVQMNVSKIYLAVYFRTF
jgi:hypothetical protein